MGKSTKADKVKSLPGLVAWLGGKRQLAGRLVERIEATEHSCYAEPFVGMGGVFFRRRQPAASEVLNDLNGDVVNLFRCVREHPEALLGCLRYLPTSRSEFDRFRRANALDLTDIQRAAQFFYIAKLAFGGRPRMPSFGTSAVTAARFSPDRAKAAIRAASRRLDRVYIECLPYQDFIARWDRPTTLFYCDPPYWGCEGVYGREMFERADFERLAGLLKAVQGRFILSINDIPEIRDLFAWGKIEEAPVTYTVNGRRQKKVTELIISGGKPHERPRRGHGRRQRRPA